MLKVHSLKQPNKHSGRELLPGKTLAMGGVTIHNKNKFSVWVDKFERKPYVQTPKQLAEKKAAYAAKSKKNAASSK